MLAGDSFVFEEYIRIPNFGEPKIASPPKNRCFHIAQYFTTSIKRKISNKLHSQKVTNLAPENRLTPTFSGAVAVKLRGVGATGGPRLYYWYHWYLHLTMLRKNTWAGKSESFNWVFCCWCFFWGWNSVVDVAGTCLWVLCLVEFGSWFCWCYFWLELI